MGRFYLCRFCDESYKTTRKDNYERHLTGKEMRKHKDNTKMIFQLKQELHDLYPHKYEALEKSDEMIEKPHLIIEQSNLSTIVELQKLREEVQLLRSQMSDTSYNQTNNTQINVEKMTVNSITENHIHLNYHGSDTNFSMLTLDYIIPHLAKIPDGAAEMFKHIFLNPQYLENVNIHLINKKNKDTVLYESSDGWNHTSFENASIDKMRYGYQAILAKILDVLEEEDIITEGQCETLSQRLFREDKYEKKAQAEMFTNLLNSRNLTQQSYELTKDFKPTDKIKVIPAIDIKLEEKIPAIYEIRNTITPRQKRQIEKLVRKATMFNSELDSE